MNVTQTSNIYLIKFNFIFAGDLDGVPELSRLFLGFNQLTELKAGSVPLGSRPGTIDFIGNQIARMEAGWFYDSKCWIGSKLQPFDLICNFSQ